MVYYLIVFVSAVILSLCILKMKRPFFSFAYQTSALLNILLDTDLEESAKQKALIKEVVTTIRKLLFFILITLVSVLAALAPVILYLKITGLNPNEVNNSSAFFYISLVLGSFPLFLVPGKSKDKDYSDWSKLLHRMILDHYNLSKSLFNIEKRIYKRKFKKLNDEFVIISGLARAGTTAFTNTLYESGHFHSLSYDNMPFLLSVNLWRVFYRPKKNKLRERAHGDNLQFGYKTIEALEEYFFKSLLNDSYIKESIIEKHEIDETTYTSYIQYQNLIKRKNTNSTYLAKNNNFILRYESLRKLNNRFILIMMFRSPLDHAYSLLNQHKKFSKLHREDSFTLEYMNWLGHHEFGLNHKTMQLNGATTRQFSDPLELNYWLEIWVDYYSFVLTLPADDRFILADYEDLCEQPSKLIKSIGSFLQIDVSIDEREPYRKTVTPDFEIDDNLLLAAQSIHEQLKQKKISVDFER